MESERSNVEAVRTPASATGRSERRVYVWFSVVVEGLTAVAFFAATSGPLGVIFDPEGERSPRVG